MEAGELVDHDQHIEGRAGEIVAQGQRPPAGHFRQHNLSSNDLVAQGQHIEVSAGHEPEDVAPVSSSTRASDRQPVTPDGTALISNSAIR